MTSSSPDTPSWHSIADVERDTGLSKDTLRVWERRYGFPMPARDALGERQYDNDQLIRLRHIRRLIDAGHRPGRVVALPLDGLVELNTQRQPERIQPDATPSDLAVSSPSRDETGLAHRPRSRTMRHGPGFGPTTHWRRPVPRQTPATRHHRPGKRRSPPPA